MTLTSKNYPLNIYAIHSTFKRKDTSKLRKIIDTIVEGLPYIKTHELIGDVDNPHTYPDPCIIVPYNRYICNILLDLVDSMQYTKTFYYVSYKYRYTDKNGYHYYTPVEPTYRSTIKLSPTEGIDCLLED